MKNVDLPAQLPKLPISLAMIVKDEERFIAAAVNSVKTVLGLCDLVVVDTGSTDKTKEIATKCGARVFDFTWIDDFSAARNYAAKKAKHDWILFLDADEEIVDADMDELAAFLENTQAVGAIMMTEMSDNTRNPLSRLYNKRFYNLTGSIHEQITPVESHDNMLKKTIRQVPVTFIHHGYLPEVSIAKNKHKRNVGMLEKALTDTPDDPYLLYCLGKTYFNNDSDLQKACFYFDKAISFIDDFRLDYAYRAVECYGYALLKTAQYDKALTFMEQFIGVYDKKASFRFLCAHILQNNALFQEAVEMYESCIGTARSDGTDDGIGSYLSYYNIGVILECVGMIDDAKAMYKNCGDYELAKKRLTGL
ncbi:MAG: glycosyltransferase [Oscillospiraceae bacterium]|jgi:glycosyltransferase involved in cell wall biosynthesis|nr:glycosyltransferase [Oscillospiraceae bacterium]